MKCDVCLTKIPLGEKRCPNCGYIVRPEGKTSFNETSPTHGHISTDIPSIHDEPVRTKPPVYKGKKNKNTKQIIAILLSLGIAFFCFMIPVVIFMLDEDEPQPENMRLVEQINEKEYELSNELENTGFENIKVYEAEGDTYIYGDVCADKGDFSYTISFYAYNDDTYEFLDISSISTKEYDPESPYIDKEAVNVFVSFFDDPSIIELINEGYSNLEEDENGNYKYDDYQEVRLYSSGNNQYRYSYLIPIGW